MFEVKVCRYAELPADVDKTWLSNNGSGAEWSSYLLVYHDGALIRTESSAMEPEDVSFWRDLAWVKDAIEEAYECGKVDGVTST